VNCEHVRIWKEASMGLFNVHQYSPVKAEENHEISVMIGGNSARRLYASSNIFLTAFYSPYRTLSFLNGLLDPQTFGRTPWLGDQSNARHLPKHRNRQTHIHAPSRFRTCNLNVQAVVDSTCLRQLCY
jgi:hypothetical protein